MGWIHDRWHQVAGAGSGTWLAWAVWAAWGFWPAAAGDGSSASSADGTSKAMARGSRRTSESFMGFLSRDSLPGGRGLGNSVTAVAMLRRRS